MWAALAAAIVLVSAPAQPPTRIVFASARTGISEIYSVEPSGRKRAQLTFQGEWTNAFPSPDGRWVAATRRDAGCCGELWIMRADGQRARRVASSAGDAVWAADSKRLYFWSRSQLWAVPAAGGTPRVASDVHEVNQTVSPDGRSVAFIRPAETYLDLVVRRRGRDVVAAHEVTGAPSWSPDGRWIAIRDRTESIELVHLGGGAPRVLVRSAPGSGPTRIPWSPDGRWLAYQDVRGVHVVPVSGRGAKLLMRGEERNVAWSPSGNAVAFTGPAAVGVVTLAGRVRLLLRRDATEAGDATGDIGWTPHVALPYRRPEPIQQIVKVTPMELSSRVPIRALSADGDRVAYSLCPSVLGAWRPGNAMPVPLGRTAAAACAAGAARTDYDLALAGERLAYLTVGGGNQVSWSLALTTLARRDAGTGVATGSGCCAGDPLQPPIGDLLGDGSLLVYGTWSRTGPESIWRLDGAGPPVQIAQGLEPLSLDAGRIVGRREDGSLRLLDSGGVVLRGFDVAALGAALAGDHLAVLVQGQLRDYSTSTGELLHTWTLPDVPSAGRCRRLICPPARLRLEDAARGLALYTVDGAVHLLRLRDGSDYTVPTATGAELEDSGLFYTYAGDASWPGRIRFIPFAELPL